MAKLKKGFNANDHEEMNSYTVYPPGNYTAEIIKSTSKSSGEGKEKKTRVSLIFEILKGEFKGKTFLIGLNLENPNIQTVEIAEKELAAICRAVNVPNPKDTEQLHRKPMSVDLIVKPAKDKFPEHNTANGYHKLKSGGKNKLKEEKKVKGKKKKSDGKAPWKNK